MEDWKPEVLRDFRKSLPIAERLVSRKTNDFQMREKFLNQKRRIFHMDVEKYKSKASMTENRVNARRHA